MPKIYINNLGYLAGPAVENATTELEVSEEQAEKLSIWPVGQVWRYNEDTKEFSLESSHDEGELRALREVECFSVVNRSFMWYLTLSEEQKTELQEWYQAWLDVTETEIIPEKPVWLD
jgi:hypothetical protein